AKQSIFLCSAKWVASSQELLAMTVRQSSINHDIGADIRYPDGYINPARHVRAFGVRMGISNDGIDTIERRPR
ncbi:MAG: hypothetical protein ABIL01_31580, partial [Pseudomonadota bacterium]